MRPGTKSNHNKLCKQKSSGLLVLWNVQKIWDFQFADSEAQDTTAKCLKNFKKTFQFADSEPQDTIKMLDHETYNKHVLRNICNI